MVCSWVTHNALMNNYHRRQRLDGLEGRIERLERRYTYYAPPTNITEDRDISGATSTTCTVVCVKGGQYVGSTDKNRKNIEHAYIAAKNEIMTLAMATMKALETDIQGYVPAGH